MPDDFQPESISVSIDGVFELVFEDHPEYFFACVEGNATDPASIDAYQTRIAAEIAKRKYDRVMIKRDVPLTNNSADHCSIIYKVPAWEMRLIKYAFIDVKAAHLSSYKLALMFARGNGVQAEIFGDTKTAKEWLLC